VDHVAGGDVIGEFARTRPVGQEETCAAQIYEAQHAPRRRTGASRGTEDGGEGRRFVRDVPGQVRFLNETARDEEVRVEYSASPARRVGEHVGTTPCIDFLVEVREMNLVAHLPHVACTRGWRRHAVDKFPRHDAQMVDPPDGGIRVQDWREGAPVPVAIEPVKQGKSEEELNAGQRNAPGRRGYRQVEDPFAVFVHARVGEKNTYPSRLHEIQMESVVGSAEEADKACTLRMHPSFR